MTKRKDPKDFKKNGRPTKWTPEINDKLIEYFSLEPSYEREVVHTNKKGETWTSYEERPNRLPSFIGFAMKIKVDTDTLVEWAKEENEAKYPGFSVSYKRAKELQKQFLIDNALSGLFNATFSIFTAKNITDMRDKTETDVTSGGEKVAGFIIVKDSMDAKNKGDNSGSTPNN